MVSDVRLSYKPFVWSILTPLGFLGFCHTKTTGQAGERRQRNIDYKGHCAFCLSSFPCRLAYCTVLCAHTHAWLAVSARAMQREGCSEHRQASTGHQLSTVDTNQFKGGKTWSVLEVEYCRVYLYLQYKKFKWLCCWGKHAALTGSVNAEMCKHLSARGHAGCQLNGCCVLHRKLNSQSWTRSSFH